MNREELEKLLNSDEAKDEEAEEEVLTDTSPDIPTSSLIEKVRNDDREEEVIQKDTER